MLFDGKRPQDLSTDELEAAAVYCTRMLDEAIRIAKLNEAGLAELALEYERRLPGARGVPN